MISKAYAPQLSADEQQQFEREARDRQHEAELEAGVGEAAATEDNRQSHDDSTGRADTAGEADGVGESHMDKQAEEPLMTDDLVYLEALVEGRVQGVGYRYATRLEAEAEGLTGYARNLPDGRVKVLLCGPHDGVERVAEWLDQGPDQAEVTQVTTREVTLDEPPRDFTTG